QGKMYHTPVTRLYGATTQILEKYRLEIAAKGTFAETYLGAYGGESGHSSRSTYAIPAIQVFPRALIMKAGIRGDHPFFVEPEFIIQLRTAAEPVAVVIIVLIGGIDLIARGDIKARILQSYIIHPHKYKICASR